MKKRIAIYIAVHFLTTEGFAQSNIDTVLRQIEANNKSINANKKYWDAKRMEYKTGLTPYDPQVEYDYLYGSPAGAGNQRDFSVTQRLDFPTVYKRKKELSTEQVTQSEMQRQVFRQDILLESKLIILELIYLNKKQSAIEQRRIQTETLVSDYQKKFDKGEVIVLDINKAKLELLNIQHEFSMNQSNIQALTTKLSELNGGIAISISDTIYPDLPVIPDFETLDSTIEANDPLIKTYEQEKLILQQQIAVQKAMNLPKIEAGYHSQAILGQSYRGIHAGITVPLWENRNKVKAAQAHLEYAKENTNTHLVSHRFENKRLYDQLGVRLNTMREYRRLVAERRNTELLDKALRLGQITIIDYFRDQAYYFASFDKYLQLEVEYHQAVAELYKFRL